MSDPRDSSLEVPFSLPKSWKRDVEALSTFSMLLAGGVMVTRNRFLALPTILLAIAGWINSRPRRAKDGGQGLSAIAFALAASFAAYIPLFVLPPSQATQSPLPSS